LVGGPQRDVLEGGADSDVFYYRDISDVTQHVESIDDFVHGEDLLDLHEIDAIASTGANDAFTFIGTAEFTAAGQIRYEKFGPGNLTIVDLKVADPEFQGQVVLVGLIDLTAGDFAL
jgi:hypothetical protein